MAERDPGSLASKDREREKEEERKAFFLFSLFLFHEQPGACSLCSLSLSVDIHCSKSVIDFRKKTLREKISQKYVRRLVFANKVRVKQK